MTNELITIEEGLQLQRENVIINPDDKFFIQYLKPYYVLTKDWQYLFASPQRGRRPDRAFYLVPEGYKLGYRQQKFDLKIGKKLYKLLMEYLKGVKVILQEGIQGESSYEVGLRIVTSIDNPHSAYIAWMGKYMIYPPKPKMKISCFNYIIPERLPEKWIKKIKEFWPDYEPEEPLTLYDFTEFKKDIRRVLGLSVNYFGGAFKKPNLTMVWHKAEGEGLISYHGSCTTTRVLKGLSGTGKTTLAVGPELEQDDACLGKLIYQDGKIERIELIGLEAASFAKSEGLSPTSPEWVGLMKSTHLHKDGTRPVVLAMNIDCEGVEYVWKQFGKYKVELPRAIEGQRVGSLQCRKYEQSRTTNGRFIFLFSELNKNWLLHRSKYLQAEVLCFKRFDIMEPIFRVIDPVMACAFDSACESIITSAIAGQKVGKRVRSYSATDFMAREQAEQALLKWKVYKTLGLGLNGKLIFCVINTGFVGEHDLDGKQIRKLDSKGKPIPKRDKDTGKIIYNELNEPIYEGQGEKITVEDTKKLLFLVENKKIDTWLENPLYGYLIPSPKELELKGLKNFSKRFNPLRYYTPEQILEFARRDIKERTEFLKELFRGQTKEKELQEVIYFWQNLELPSVEKIKDFYERYYR